MTRLILLSLLLTMILTFDASILKAETTSEKTPCSSIANHDLDNSTINDIKFVDGEGCTSDSVERPDQCDWEHSMVRDDILKPVREKDVRLVILRSDHVTGTGSWGTVLILDCVNGSLRKVFEKKYLLGEPCTTDTIPESWLPMSAARYADNGRVRA